MDTWTGRPACLPQSSNGTSCPDVVLFVNGLPLAVIEPKNAADENALIKGMLNKENLRDLIRHFIVFENSKTEDSKTGVVTIETVKKLATETVLTTGETQQMRSPLRHRKANKRMHSGKIKLHSEAAQLYFAGDARRSQLQLF